MDDLILTLVQERLACRGDSTEIDPKGEVLCQKRHDPVGQTITLSHAHLEAYRSSFPVWMDSDFASSGNAC